MVTSKGTPAGGKIRLGQFHHIDETKLHPPTPRTDWIGRPRLLRRIEGAQQSQVLLVAAPAGYGKTTLVSQWVDSDDVGTVAWVELDAADNDPTRLWTHLAAALELIGCPVDPDAAQFIAMRATAITQHVIPRMVSAMAVLGRPLTIVLEDCHVLRSGDCCDQLDHLIDSLPERVRLVLVSRSNPNLRLGRLRVDGRLAEIRTADLAFTPAETAALLATAGVALTDDALAVLVGRTEGWPAAIYLATLSLAGRDDPDEFVDGLTGSDRFIADYLSEEVLARQEPELREFILCMSIFDRFNASLANHVLASLSSLRSLRLLEHTNLFLIPLHPDGWFRFHHLFATFAQSMLEVEHPDLVPILHRRGADWFAAHESVEETIRHLLAAGDFDGAAVLIQANWVRFFDAGRSATVVGWLTALRGTSADHGAAAAATAAWMGALTGNQPEMRRRLGALASAAEDGPLPDGTRSAQSALALVQGLFGYDGPDRMLEFARRAVELENDCSTPWYAVACAALGHASYVIGDVALAREMLGEAARSVLGPNTIRILALSTLALCEAEQGNHLVSARLAQQSMDIVVEHAMQAMPHVTHAYTACGVALLEEGRHAEAATMLDEGINARRQLPGLSSWPLIHILIARARVAVASGDPVLATELLAEVDELTPWPDRTMAVMRSRIEAARRGQLVHGREKAVAGEPLTPREEEILRRLQSSQTLREIATDLYVSHNTVKTITLAVYRKLGAHSRSEAIALAHMLDVR